MSAYAHPVFGPERPNAARAAIWALHSAIAAYNEAGGCWGDPSGRLFDRITEARAIRAMYAECMDSSLEGV
jgi:hypothetical protein